MMEASALDFKQLNYFVTVYKTANFTSTASQLHISQQGIVKIHTKSGTGTWLSSLFKGSQSLAAYFLWRFILYSGSSFDKRIPEYINNTKQCKKEGPSFKNRIFCQHSGFLKPHRSFYMALESASSRSSDRNIKRNRLCL